MTATLKHTMYLDYWSGYWDWDKPTGKMGDDYDVLRKGSRFQILTIKKEIEDWFAYYEIPDSYRKNTEILLHDKKGNWFGYQDWDEVGADWEVWDK